MENSDPRLSLNGLPVRDVSKTGMGKLLIKFKPVSSLTIVAGVFQPFSPRPAYVSRKKNEDTGRQMPYEAEDLRLHFVLIQT
jgi:hypothetical protein